MLIYLQKNSATAEFFFHRVTSLKRKFVLDKLKIPLAIQVIVIFRGGKSMGEILAVLKYIKVQREVDYIGLYFAIEKYRKMQSKMQSFATLLIPF